MTDWNNPFDHIQTYFHYFRYSLSKPNTSIMSKISRKLLIIPVLALLLCRNLTQAQEQYYEDYDRTYLQSGTLMFGMHFNKFEPLFDKLNFNLLEESGAYDFTGVIDADSTNFIRRSNYFGLGFNINGIQFLMSGGFRRSSALNIFNLGFGIGFNHVLHFDYKSGQPKVWFEGLMNYNYMNSKMQLKSYTISQPPMAFFNGTQFPDIGIVVDGAYRLNIETQRHILEPVAALNFALSRAFGLRFAAAYSFFLNTSQANFLLRFSPNPQDNSLARPDKLVFDNALAKINLDNRRMDSFPLDMSRWNFNVSLVFRMLGSD